MAVFTLRNAQIRIGGSFLISDHVRECSVEMTAPAVDFTAMGAAGTQRAQGVRDDKFTLTAFSDFAASSIDATMYPYFESGTTFLVEVWPFSTATSSTNPCYSGTVILETYTPIGGAAGDAAMTPLEMPVNGFISRATA